MGGLPALTEGAARRLGWKAAPARYSLRLPEAPTARPLRLLILGPGRTRPGDEGAGNSNMLAPPLLEKERDLRTQTPARQACGFLRDAPTGNYVLPKETVF